MAASAAVACLHRPFTLILPSHRPPCSDISAAIAPSRLLYKSFSSAPLSLPSPEQPPRHRLQWSGHTVVACLPSTSPQESSSSEDNPTTVPATRLFVSGLAFRTSQEGLTNAFKNFGELKEVHLVMDKVANRSKGFAFIRYATEEEAGKAIEGMHGKFLDGRVIFVEVARPRSEVRQNARQSRRQF